MVLIYSYPMYAVQEKALSSKQLVTGLVKDENGETLIGVNIVVKGAETTGTVSDIDGRFSLSVDLPAVLIFSYLGYDTQEVNVTNHSPLLIQLKPATEFLDEVVIV
ncbi:MAG: carboxypeptidase-like regulatory domain-containing protein, partial [Proteiniphilum sp.]